MKLMLLSVAILIALLFIVQAHSLQNLSVDGSTSFDNYIINTQITENETTTDTQKVIEYGEFGATMTNGLITIIVAFVAVGAVAGIHVLGSGLSEISVKIIYTTILGYAIWIILSVWTLNGLANDGLLAIPYFGWVIYFLLTGAYTFGIYERVTG